MDKPENRYWEFPILGLSDRKVLMSAICTILTLGLHTTSFANELDHLSILMEEICSNGIDDDEDGLFDAYDPDCFCNLTVSATTIVPNGDFEAYDQCCLGMENQAGVCIKDWFLVTLSPDFVSRDCSSEIAIFDQLNIVSDGSFIDMGFSSSPSSDVRSESIGVCLSQALNPCESYSISFSTAILSDLDLGVKKDDLFTIYGLPSCPDTSEIDVMQGFCESPLFGQAQELATIRLFDVERDRWVNHLQNFQPNFEISSIVLYTNCNQDPAASIGTFLYLDNIEINPSAQLCIIDGMIIQSGDSCGDEITLTASAPEADTYQWYRDSLPIAGATDRVLSITTSASAVAYSTLISNQNSCLLLDPVIIQQAALGSNIIYDTLCAGREYTFYDTLILDSGIYTEVVGQTINGCDSLEVLNLYFHPVVEAVFDIQPGLNLYLGESLTITPDQSFLDQLSSFRWFEQGVPQDGNNSTLTVRLDQAQIRNFTFEYTSNNGCTLNTGFSAEWIAQLSNDEVCDNGIDDDLDGLIDFFDDDCPCTAGQINQVMLSETICEGSTFLFGDRMLEESGIYRDTFVNIINCDSIVSLDLTVTNDFEETIDITINEGEFYNFHGTDYSESGIYSFVVEDNNTSCDSTFYLNLIVNPPFSIYIPNVISLNSTTGNDEFLISANREISIVELKVFNRWGNIVHNGSGTRIDEEDTYVWDGHYKGQQVAQGLYIYKLTYEEDEERRTVVGDVTVIR